MKSWKSNKENHEIKTQNESEIVTSYGRNKNLNSKKDVARQVLRNNSKNINWIRAAKLDQPTVTIDWTEIISITWTLVYAVKLCLKYEKLVIKSRKSKKLKHIMRINWSWCLKFWYWKISGCCHLLGLNQITHRCCNSVAYGGAQKV